MSTHAGGHGLCQEPAAHGHGGPWRHAAWQHGAACRRPLHSDVRGQRLPKGSSFQKAQEQSELGREPFHALRARRSPGLSRSNAPRAGAPPPFGSDAAFTRLPGPVCSGRGWRARVLVPSSGQQWGLGHAGPAGLKAPLGGVRTAPSQQGPGGPDPHPLHTALSATRGEHTPKSPSRPQSHRATSVSVPKGRVKAPGKRRSGLQSSRIS